MVNYPAAVTKIVNDYLERVKSKLRHVPPHEQDDFLKELHSHVYEAYQQTSGEDDVARILGVLRKLGEPTEVVSDRLPGAMMRSGTKKNLPLYILGGAVIAFFGVPLGFGGMGVVVGLLCALAGVLFAYYAVAGSVLFVGALFALLGFLRMFLPELWDKMVQLGYIQMNGPVGDFLNQLTPFAQGLIILLVASVFVACGLGMLRLGQYMLRGLRFLFGMTFDWIRTLSQKVKRSFNRHRQNGLNVSATAFVKP